MGRKFDETHQHILRCGVELLLADAFDAVSIQQICDRAGISRPNFYKHFKGKEQLLAEYYMASMYFTDSLREWVYQADSPWAAIVRLQLMYIRYTCDGEHADLIARYLIFQLSGAQEFSLEPIHNQMESDLTTLIRDAQKAGLVQNTYDPYYLTKSILMLQTGNLFRWCASPSRFDSCAHFFGNLEALLCVPSAYRSLWKLEESYIPLPAAPRL